MIRSIFCILMFCVATSQLCSKLYAQQNHKQAGEDSRQLWVPPIAPAATSRLPISASKYLSINEGGSLQALASRLLEGLTKAKHSDLSWFLVKNSERGYPCGVAVFTKQEHIPASESLGKSGHVSQAADILQKLFFGAPPQRKRAFAFYLSNCPLTRSIDPTISFHEVEQKFQLGARTPRFDVLEEIKTYNYECVVFVYEFLQSPTTGKMTLLGDSNISAEEHLRLSGISKALGYE